MTDWQAYLDQSMSSADRAAAEHLLATDPSARAELEGLRAFIKEVRKAGQRELVPATRVADIVGGPNRSKKLPFLVGKLAFAGLAAALLVNYVLLDPDRPNREWWSSGWYVTSDATKARNWLRGKSIEFMPDVPSPAGAELQGACYGGDWVCFVYRKNGDQYRLYSSTDSDRFVSGKMIATSPNEPALFHTGRGTGWMQGGSAFYIDGPNPKFRDEMALTIARVVAKMDPRDCR